MRCLDAGSTSCEVGHDVVGCGVGRDTAGCGIGRDSAGCEVGRDSAHCGVDRDSVSAGRAVRVTPLPESEAWPSDRILLGAEVSAARGASLFLGAAGASSSLEEVS